MEQRNGSRIPRFAGVKTAGLTNGQPDPLPNIGKKPSRLEQMQAEYQRNILKEKEEKMISLYEESQQKALQRVNQKKGHVRDFFNERRAMGNGDNPLSPPIEHHYQQKRSEAKLGGHENGYVNMQSPKYINQNRGTVKGIQKQSAGRDRSNLLAPIQRNVQQDNENPFAKRKPQIVRPRTMGKLPNKENGRNMNMPMSAPTGDNFIGNEFDDDDSPGPNPQQLFQLQQKRKLLQSQRSSTRSIHTRQNGSSSNRQNGGLRGTPESSRKPPSSLNTYDYEPSDEDEGFGDNNSHGDDEIKRKQQELLAQIEAQQRELDRLRNERKQVETEEKKEAERRKRVEEERKKRQAEEDRRRQKAEEEERMRQQWEEEKYEKQEAEKRKLRRVLKNNHANDSDSGYVNDDPYDKTPTPPPKPRPANSRKSVPQKRAPAKNTTPSPVPKGDHMALYENAINEEGAFENVGRLKSCFNCGRKFAEERLEKHEQFCRNLTKKRKVMDPSKVRTKGTELEQYQGHKAPTQPQAKKNNWRSKHQSFIEAIRYAKKCSQIEKEGGNLADLPPPPPSENPDYVQCPHCTRRFNQTAAERHIPHCKNSRAKPPPRRR